MATSEWQVGTVVGERLGLQVAYTGLPSDTDLSLVVPEIASYLAAEIKDKNLRYGEPLVNQHLFPQHRPISNEKEDMIPFGR